MMACSCSLIPSKQIEVISKPIERTIVQPIMPRQIDLKDPYWYVVSDKNIEEFLERVEKDQGQLVFVAMSVSDYELMSYNMQELKRYINELKEVVVYYRKVGLSLIKKFEGCELEAYKCAAGVWTIGYGSTKGVKEGDTLTEEETDSLLLHEMDEYEGYVLEAVEMPLSQHQFDAIVSWTFNLGPSNLNASTMLKVLNKGDYEDVPAQIKRWNKAGGKVLEGLVRRREAEALLFEGKEWHQV